MDDLRHWLQVTVEALHRFGARFAVVGGLAVGIRSESRFTRDVDIAIAAADDTEAEAVLGELIRIGFRPVMELDHTTRGRLATMRLAPPTVAFVDLEAENPVIVDLIFASCGIEPEVVAEATPATIFPGLKAPVAGCAHLIAMKLVSVNRRRRKDAGDLEALVQRATPADLARTRALLDLIHARGYARDRNLHRMLDEYVRDARAE